MDNEDQGLPSDFDAETYLALNPDVKRAGVEPELHYLSYGLLEGRSYKINIPEHVTADFNYVAYRKYLHASDIENHALLLHYLTEGRQVGLSYKGLNSENSSKLRKWYFCVSESSLERPGHDWKGMIISAVTSALSNTNLTPILLYDGAPSSFTELLQCMGVNVIFHRVSIYEDLKKFCGDNIQSLAIASGAFLRIDIPEIETQDDYVIYTDCDVLFLDQPIVTFDLPKYFACAPQSSKSDYENDMNSGVLLINVSAMRQILPKFREFIIENLDKKWPGFDQAHYRNFFAGLWDYLPLTFNWKPYWSINSSAQIIHWHGPKPESVIDVFLNNKELPIDAWRVLFERSPDAYKYYVKEYLLYSQISLWFVARKRDYFSVNGAEIMTSAFRYRLRQLNKIGWDSGSGVEGNLFYHHLKRPEFDSSPDVTRKSKRIAFEYAVSRASNMLEIGFNAGHSCLLALSSNPGLTITAVDIFTNDYVKSCSEFLISEFKGQLTIIQGDSTEILPKLITQGVIYDFFHIDGGHGTETCRTDILNCLKLAAPGARILIDDSNAENIKRVINEYLEQGQILSIKNPSWPSAESFYCEVVNQS